MSNSTIVKKSSLQFLLVFIFGLASLSALGQSRTCLRENCFDVVSFDAEPILESGSPLSVGAVYRFPNAAGGINSNPPIDILVEVLELNRTSLLEIDVSSDGLPRAFQPRITANNSGDISALFRIRLVDEGTTTPTTSVCFFATPFDIDGETNLQEIAELSLTDAYTRSAVTRIDISRNGNVIRGRNTDNQAAPVQPIDEDPRYTFSNYYENRNSFLYRIGKVGTGSQASRFFALVLERAQFAQPVTVFVTQPLICGSVLRDDGTPIGNVVVILRDENGNELDRTTTDGSGDYQFQITRDPSLGSETFIIEEIDPASDGPTGFDLASVSDTDGANDNTITVEVAEASIVNNDFVDGPDFDQDGIADSIDLDDDNDGITDVDEGGDTLNTDGNGLPNRIDRDADDDGCPDVIEGGFLDPDGDQQVGGTPVTVNSNGLVTSGGGQTVNGAGDDYNVRPNDGDSSGTADFLEAGTDITITSQPQNDTAILAGNNTAQFSVAVTGSNPIYQWQVSSGGAFTNLANNARYSGATTNTLTITNAPAAFNRNLYRVVITSSSYACANEISNSALLIVGSTLAITKSDRSGVFDEAGEVITYDVVVTNTGNSTLTNINLSDNNGTLSQTFIGSLGAGASVNITSTHVVTQGELNVGQVLNQITGTGTNTTGDTISDLSDDPGIGANVDTNGNGNPDDITVTPLVLLDQISIIKTGTFNDENNDGLAQVGETISYSFTVTNTGTTTLNNIRVIDPLLNGPNGSLSGSFTGSLAPGENTTAFSGSYTIQQADIEAQSRSNQATAIGTPPAGRDDVTDDSDDDSNLEDDPTVTTLPEDSSIALIKTSVFNDENNDGLAQDGETITYSFTVSNTGATTLTNVVITDPLLVAPNGSLSGGPIASLASGASDSTTFTGSYTIQQADIDSGSVSNQALARGTTPDGDDVTDDSDDNSNLEDDPTVTTLPEDSSIALIKTSVFNDENNDGLAQDGETITYSFTVSNTGATTLTNVVITDPLLVAPNGSLSGGPIASLASGASDSTTFTGSYTIQQADIDSGSVSNQALATGTTPDGDDVTDDSDDNSNLEDDPTVTTLPEDSSIALIKTSVFNDENNDGLAQDGETITYSFTVSNTGATTLTNVVITDPLLVAPNGSLSGGPIASLASGASDSTTFTGSYTIQQADIDSGSVSNQALARGTTPDGDDVTDDSDDNSNLEDDPTVTTLPEDSSIALIKTSVFNDENNDGLAQDGETITYSFTVSNTGATTLTNVVITDPLLVAPNGSLSGGPIASLASGASDSTTFTGSYTIQQADIDSGSVSNQALARGTTPDGDDVTDDSDDNSNLEDDPTVTTLPEDSSIALIKTSVFNDENNDGLAQDGETITYSFTVSNTGATTLTNVVITDPLLVAPNGSLSGGPIASLASGASDSTTFTGSYTIQQADIDSGSVSNQALARGTTPDGDDVTDDSDDNSNLEDDPTVTTLPEDSSIALIKTSVFNDENNDGLAQDGETITYSFTVSNTGATTLTNVVITDPLLVAPNGSLSGGPIASLASGASDSTTFTGSYTIQQADIDSGSVSNQALATGTTPDGDDVTDDSDDNSNLEDDPTVTTLPEDSSIALIKTSVFNDENNDGLAQDGETITYSFTVSNTGATTLTNVVITDPLLVAPNGSLSGGPIASLASGASDSTTFTGSYTIQQADIDSGSVSNQALARGTTPDGDDVTDDSDDNSNLEDDPTVTTLPEDSSIALIKTSVFNDENNDGLAQDGETITYSFTVSNTGATTLTNVVITDPLLVAPNGSLSGGPIASLASGASDSTTFTGSYTIQQADIDSGSVSNQALARGTTPDGDDVTDDSDDNSNLEDDPTVTTLPEDSSIALIKTSVFNDENNDGLAQDGETITYSFTVSNTGATTLTNVVITDPLLVAPNGSLSGGPIASLASGASDSTTFTGSYTIQQADIDSGSVSNQALARGTTPDGDDVTDDSDDDSNLEDDPTVTTLLQNGQISLIKIGVFNDENNDGIAQVGESINYSFVITNTGNTTLTNITITDPLLVAPNGSLIGGPISILEPGDSDSTTFTGTYTLQLSDVNALSVTNQATATGQDPNNVDVSDLSDDNDNFEDDPTVTTYDAVDSITLIKVGTFNDENNDGLAQDGETISYNFTIRNAGNRTISNITLSDILLESAFGMLSGGSIPILNPGQIDTTTFTGTYTIQQTDIDALSVTNQATVTGQDPDNNNVIDDSDNSNPLQDDPTVTTLPEDSSIALIKTSVFNDENNDGLAQDGETITYSFTVSNTGATTLTNVVITDPLLVAPNGSLSGGPIASLASGASDSTTFTGSYTIQQADIDSGSVSNQALARGTTPDGDDVTDDSDDNSNLEDDPTVTTLPEDSSIALIKTSVFNDENNDGLAQDGETITYSFTVSNTGATTLTNVVITDPLLVAPNGSLSGGPIASLASGASDSTTFTGSYTIQQADIDSGSVSNQALARGTTPDGDDVTDDSDDNSNLEDDPTVTTLPEDSSIALIKTSVFNDENNDGLAQDGETITYSFTVSNTGATTLTNVVITDPLLVAPNGSLSGGPIASLASGASDSTTFTGSYTIQQADIDSGSVSNQALARGTTPDGDDVTDDSDDNSNLEDDPTVTTLPEDSSIALIKTSVFNDENNDGLAQDGETITYSFTVSNTGATTLTNVVITDPLLVAPNGSLSGGPIASLASGASDSTTFTGSYTIQQADIDSGSVSNQALARGTTPDGDDVTDDSDDNSNLEDDPTVTTLPEDSSIALIKTSVFNDENNDGLAQDGETITYSFTVSNTGATTLTNVVITDPLLVAPNGSLSGGPIASLASGASDSTTFTGSYTIQQADIDSGSVSNQALARGTTPDGDDVTDDSDDNSNLEDDPTVTTLPEDSSIALIKTSVFNDENNDGLAQDGETITYSFTVSNTGATTLTNVVITDPLLVAPNGSLSGGPIASLASGASDSTTFTGSYTIQQADIDSGSVSNQALATGTTPDGDDVTDDSDDNSNLEDDPTVTTLPEDSSIALIKTSVFNDENNDGLAQDGETITYSFTVSNTGATTLTNVVITDPLLVAPNGSLSGGPIASLASGASDSTTFTGSYTIQQADIDSGSVSNQALARGTTPDGDDVTDDSDDNSNLEDDPTVTTLPEDSSIALIKTSVFNDENNDGLAQDGETITYSFTVSNTGATTLTNVVITDPLLVAPNGSLSGGPIASLASGASDSTTFTGSYTIQQADIDSGSVSNQALARGTTPDGDDVTDDSDDNSNLEDDPTVTTLPEDSEISLIKTSVFNDENNDGLAQDGETITYSFTVSNTGATTLTNVVITDPLLVAPNGSLSGGPIASLASGASDSTTFTGSYTIQQADIDSGSVSNQALATGTTPDGDDVTDDSDDNSNLEDDPTVTTLPEDSDISLLKISTFNDENNDGFAQVGETITYSFTVSNTGATTLTNVVITDPLLVAPNGSLSGGPIASLASGASDSTTFTGSYTIQQADIDAGVVTNQALGTGTTPDGDDVTDNSDDPNNPTDEDPDGDGDPDDPTDTDLPSENGSFSILKEADQELFTQIGDVLTYSITVTNTGDVTLTNVILTDDNADAGSLTPSNFASIAPNQTVVATARHTITEADVRNKRAINSILGTGTNPSGNDVTDISDDPNNPDDIDQDGNGDPDDPTIVYIDSDNDGTPDPIDLDDDNDGITDIVELDGVDPDIDNDKDGVPAYLDDDDNDFFIDNADGLVEPGTDLDEDGFSNHLDLDVDNDGIYDVVETGNIDLDADNDGMVDGPAGDNGIPDAAEDGGVDGAGVSGDPLESDLDADTLPNYKDQDSDGDGITDNIESQSSADYILPSGQDTDGNGVDDAYDTLGSPITPVNTEVDFNYTNQDALPDYLDLDSDGDNVPDVIEGNDFNADGIPDVDLTGTDNDNDGLDDAFDGSLGGFGDINGQLVVDTPFDLPNRDGLNDNPDFRDEDDDEDGLLTFEQGGPNNDPGMGEDVDNDGDPTNDDTDNDGTPNYLDPLDDTALLDLDDDNDGIPDIVEVGSNPDIDNDGDGVPAYLDDDDTDDTIGNDDGVVNPEFDADGDGISNHLDLDSDNDGIYDVNETGNSALDADNDGIVDGPEGVNGIPDAAEDGGIDGNGVSALPRDTDLDNLPDYLDQDADADGITDNVEAQDTFDYIAPSGNDIDNNGVDDAYDTNGNPIEEFNFDGDDQQDYIDVDSDNDNVPDSVEGHDFDHQGEPDVLPSGTDVDNDGLDDAYDGDTSGFGDPDGLDLSGDPIELPDLDGTEDVDYRDVDDDGDTVDTIFEDYDGDDNPINQDTDSDGIPDYLDDNDDGDPFDTIDEGPDPDGDQNPNTGNTRDTDGDGIFDYLEFDEVEPVCGEPIVFNGISPDGNNQNDFLVIDQIECYPVNNLEIFNRWGVKVFETDNYGTNGQVFRGISEGRITIQQGDELPVGTYYYIFRYDDLNNDPQSKAGYIYIQR